MKNLGKTDYAVMELIEDLMSLSVSLDLNPSIDRIGGYQREFDLCVELGAVGERWRKEFEDVVVKAVSSKDVSAIEDFRYSRYLHLKPGKTDLKDMENEELVA